VTNVTLKTAVLAGLLAGLSPLALAQIAAGNPGSTEALYSQLQSVGLDKTRVYKVREGALDRGAIHISLDDGTIAFTADVDGRITGAFFRGEGEILLSPPDSTERRSLAFFTGAAILEERFSTAYLRFDDDVYDELRSSLRTPEEAEQFASQWNTTAQNLAPPDALRLLVSFINTPRGDAAEPADRFLHAYLQGGKLGTFDVRYDSLAPEQISAGEHRIMRGEDFYDVWMSFNIPSSARASGTITLAAPRTPDFDISEFKIQAQITPPTALAATAILTIVPRRDGKRLLLFELSRLLQVSSVEADGKAVEFIHNPAMEGSQLARRGNDVVAVILPVAIRAGQKIQLSFKYSGAVLSEAANGLLYVGEHGTWYPNIGFAEAAFDLEFHCPIGWTLVATGRRIDIKTVGTELVSRWKSERPMPVAGFNLGKYYQTSVRAGNTTVVTYATSNVERSFGGPGDSPSSMGDSPGKTPPLLLNSRPDDPTPARNVQIVGNTAARALEFYQQRFGPFPYSELSLTQFPGKVSQGWPGLVFLSSYVFLTEPERERFQTDPKVRLVMEQTTAHEVAHQWWGDLVSWNGYRDQWIMEALANYSALMLLESRNPAAFRELLQKFRDDLLAKDHQGQQLTDAGPVTLGVRLSSSQFPNGYEAISYGRGTWLIHMLRCMLRDADRSKGRSKNTSDEAFLSTLRKLRTEYEGKSLTTAELMSVFESELPASLRYEGRKSLDWFYQGWVNGSSIPALGLRDVKFANKDGATAVTGIITQEHVPESLVTAVPVYAVVDGKNTFLARVFVEGPETQFHLSAPAGTRKIVIDPERTLLARAK
jgi:hypothetical protein